MVEQSADVATGPSGTGMVAGLVDARMLVEVEAVAYVPRSVATS